MNAIQPHRRSAIPGPRGGFTLVEMLVAVALVVLMMTLFATVFQLAGGAMTAQRALMENDQRARSVETVIRGDLRNRTFRELIPFVPDEDPNVGGTPFSTRRGYFYISENQLHNHTDDVLQFTVQLSAASDELFFGRARALPMGANLNQALNHPNQPVFDDGRISSETSGSRAAEVSYFLRAGRLYRRVLLLRQPFLPEDPVQPTDRSGNDFFAPNYDNDPNSPPNPNPYTGNFWSDFDYSAHYDTASGGSAAFHGLDWLQNETAAAGASGVPALAIPSNRFGHNHTNGQPREYVGPGNNQFIGRFTHQETSFGAFRYPNRIGGVGNPMARLGRHRLDLNINSRTFGVVIDNQQGVLNGPRRSEDLLLTNVHAFDIKVWDEAYGETEDLNGNGQLDPGEDINGNNQLDSFDENDNGRIDRGAAFADIGHQALFGHFRQANNNHVNPPRPPGLPPNLHWQQVQYGPHSNVANNRIFDTWHPAIKIDFDGSGTVEEWERHPPFHPHGRDMILVPTNSAPVLRPAPGNRGDDEPDGDGDYLAANRPNTKEYNSTGSDDMPAIKAIQITIRFLDVSSGQMRQLTIRQSLAD